MKWLLLALLVIAKPVSDYRVIQDYSGIACLQRALYVESRGEPVRTKRAVLDVIYTRARKSGKTVCEVLGKKWQFTDYLKTRGVRYTKEFLQSFYIAYTMSPVCRGCMYFHDTSVVPYWVGSVQRAGKFGGLIFYRERTKWA